MHERTMTAQLKHQGFSFKRQLLFFSILVVGIYVFMEACSFLAFWILDKRMFSFERIHGEQIRTMDSVDPDRVNESRQEEIKRTIVSNIIRHDCIHPYLGYVYDPSKADFPVNAYGFPGNDKTPYTKDADNQFIIGILGGSVANVFFNEGVPFLDQELKKASFFSDKELVFKNLALLGYKQPQQFFTVNYFLVLGADFDVLINIDGFNEIALPPVENMPKHVFPMFPRSWHWRVESVPDVLETSMIGEIFYLKRKQAKWAMAFAETPLHYSITADLIWKFKNLYFNNAIAKLRVDLQKIEPTESRYVTTGPKVEFKNPTEMHRDSVNIWKRSSFQLDRIADANGIEYFHFLQPNQYVPGSKKMTEEEREIAILRGNPMKASVEEGYPMMQKDGRDLVEQGVNFNDLSMIFSDVEEPLYVDNCCHFNRFGNEIMAREIAKVILETYARR